MDVGCVACLYTVSKWTSVVLLVYTQSVSGRRLCCLSIHSQQVDVGCVACLYTVSKWEIESLMNIFKQQTKAKLDRPKFRDVLHNQFDMTDDLIMDRGDSGHVFL